MTCELLLQMQIARKYLEPTTRDEMGLRSDHMTLKDDAVTDLIRWCALTFFLGS